MSLRRNFTSRSDKVLWIGRDAVVTNRLILRPASAADAQAVIDLYYQDNRAFIRYMRWDQKGFPQKQFDPSEMRARIAWRRFAMPLQYAGISLYAFAKGNPSRIVGYFEHFYDRNNNPRISYFIRPGERRKGFAAEGLKALHDQITKKTGRTHYGLEIVMGDTGSLRLLQKTGFALQGRTPSPSPDPSYAGRIEWHMRRRF